MRWLKALTAMAIFTLPPITVKQAEQRALFRSQAECVMSEGGSQGGKTHGVLLEVIQRAWASPGGLSLIARKEKDTCIKFIWRDLIAVIDRMKLPVKVLKSPASVTFPNGHTIIPGGIAPSEIDKILGPNYISIVIDETSEIIYSAFTQLLTRLNGKPGGKFNVPKIFLTQNPPSKNHWTYKLFHLNQDPESGAPKADAWRYAWIKFVPYDNLANLAPTYISMLENLPEYKRRRFLDGDYGAIEGLVFPEFDAVRHMERDKTKLVPPPGALIVRGLDFGYKHPTACVWMFERGGKIYVPRAWKKSGLTADQSATEIKRLSPWKNNYVNVSDHQSEYRLTFAREGLPTIKADKRKAAAIDLARSLISKDLIVFGEDAEPLLVELGQYRYKPTPSHDAGDDDANVVKEDDDCVDGFLYALTHLRGAGRGQILSNYTREADEDEA